MDDLGQGSLDERLERLERDVEGLRREVRGRVAAVASGRGTEVVGVTFLRLQRLRVWNDTAIPVALRAAADQGSEQWGVVAPQAWHRAPVVRRRLPVHLFRGARLDRSVDAGRVRRCDRGCAAGRGAPRLRATAGLWPGAARGGVEALYITVFAAFQLSPRPVSGRLRFHGGGHAPRVRTLPAAGWGIYLAHRSPRGSRHAVSPVHRLRSLGVSSSTPALSSRAREPFTIEKVGSRSLPSPS